MTTNPELLRIEREIPKCPLFADCAAHAGQRLELSRIAAGDPRRGTHDARILIVTEAPDRRSGQGRAYQGGTGTRIMRMFLRQDYRIALDYPDYGRGGVPSFLQNNKIYQTSAVKCVLRGATTALGERVVTNCRGKFLDMQIAQLPQLELILPMGRLAAASVLHRHLEDVDLDRIIGRRGIGIQVSDRYYAKTIIVLPHPSGTNRAFNPPVFDASDGPAMSRRKRAFLRALLAVRLKLGAMEYALRSLPDIDQLGPLDTVESV